MNRRLAAAAWAVFLLIGLPDLDVRYTFEWDSAQYARAIHHYDVAAHQPHPSGFPLYVLLLRALYPLCGNEPRTMALASLLLLAPGLWCFRKLAREVAGDAWGEGLTLLLAFGPVVSLHAFAQTNYPADFTASAVLAWLAFRLRRGEPRMIAPAWLAFAAFGGLRYSGAIVLFPLLVFGLWPHLRHHWRRTLCWGAAAAALLVVCYLPAVITSGGWAGYRENSRANALSGFVTTSVFYGASPYATLGMIRTNLIWLAMGAGLLTPLAWGGRFRRHAVVPPLFLLVWMTPNLLVTFLFHSSKPGYQMLTLPPLALALGCFLPALSTRWMTPALAAELALSWLPFLPPVYNRYRPHNELIYRALPGVRREVEQGTRRLAEQLRQLPEGTRVHAPVYGPLSPNRRTVTFDFPGTQWVDTAAEAQAGYGPTPPGARMVWREARVEFWVRD